MFKSVTVTIKINGDYLRCSFLKPWGFFGLLNVFLRKTLIQKHVSRSHHLSVHCLLICQMVVELHYLQRDKDLGEQNLEDK